MGAGGIILFAHALPQTLRPASPHMPCFYTFPGARLQHQLRAHATTRRVSTLSRGRGGQSNRCSKPFKKRGSGKSMWIPATALLLKEACCIHVSMNIMCQGECEHTQRGGGPHIHSHGTKLGLPNSLPHAVMSQRLFECFQSWPTRSGRTCGWAGRLRPPEEYGAALCGSQRPHRHARCARLCVCLAYHVAGHIYLFLCKAENM